MILRHLPNARIQKPAAFSIMEVAIALAIVSVGLLGVLGLLLPGLESSRDSNAKTIVGIVLEDVHNRLQGEFIEQTGTPFVYFYDDQGQHIDTSQPADIQDTKIYRVEVHIVEIITNNLPTVGGTSSAQTGMMASRVEVFYPIVPSSGAAIPVGSAEPKTSITYYVAPLTGPDWPAIDPGYVPRIEF